MKLLPEQTLTGFIIEQKWLLKNKSSTQSRKFYTGVLEIWYDGLLYDSRLCKSRFQMRIELDQMRKKIMSLPKEKYIKWKKSHT